MATPYNFHATLIIPPHEYASSVLRSPGIFASAYWPLGLLAIDTEHPGGLLSDLLQLRIQLRRLEPDCGPHRGLLFLGPVSFTPRSGTVEVSSKMVTSIGMVKMKNSILIYS
jgi:hypothetical protein